MRTLMINVNDNVKAPIRFFRDEDSFESLEHYVEHDLIPFCIANCPEMTTMRCAISGWKIGDYAPSEVAIAIRQAVRNSVLQNYHDFLAVFTVKSLATAIEDLIDIVTTRAILLARPSIIFTGAIGQPSVESVPRNRQLITLLNVLVYDNGQLRARHNDSFETISRMRKAASLSDLIESEWTGELSQDEENRFQDLYSALVELDSKWQIAKLKLTAKEEEKLAEFRDSPTFDVNRLRSFVWSLVSYRNRHIEVNLSDSWTRAAYRELVMGGYNTAGTRDSMSNVLNPIKPTQVAAAKGEKTAKGKPSKSKDPNVAMFSAIFKGLGA